MKDGTPPKIQVDGLSIGFPGLTVQHGISFTVKTGSIFAIMGSSGCGKSTLLKTMIGLLRPSAGTIRVEDIDYWALGNAERAKLGRRFCVLFQDGALWTSMTTGDNVALAMRMLTKLSASSIASLVRVKLAMVGLAASSFTMPADLSGGMRKRAGLARALALDPDILFFDEPSAGLDPTASRRLDDLICELRDGFGTTVVLVSHELPSLFAICDDGIFLDPVSKTPIAHGAPRVLRDTCVNETVRAFMHRERIQSDRPAPDAAHG